LALHKEGFHIRVYKLSGLFPLSLIRDIANVPSMKDYDVIIYMGSIPRPSALFLNTSNTKKMLFIHGFIYHEILHNMFSAIKKDPLRISIKTLTYLSLYDITRILGSIDFYICHSITTCDMARVPSNKRILLPQFFLDEDLSFYESIRLDYNKKLRKEGVIRLL